MDVVRVLARTCSDDVIAGALNRNGLRTGRENRWRRQAVISLRNWNDIPRYDKDRHVQEGWMNLTQAAAFLGISSRTLRLATIRGEIGAEQPLNDGPWVFARSSLESVAAAQLVQRVRESGRGTHSPTTQPPLFNQIAR